MIDPLAGVRVQLVVLSVDSPDPDADDVPNLLNDLGKRWSSFQLGAPGLFRLLFSSIRALTQRVQL